MAHTSEFEQFWIGMRLKLVNSHGLTFADADKLREAFWETWRKGRELLHEPQLQRA